jgi:hypothetical protein
MKINKAIFGVDDSYFLEFWPIQAKICKELLNIEPVLFYICDEDSDFYNDGHGLVKKIKKVRINQNGNVINTGLLACIVRMYGTRYFPDEVCITCDLDMLMINKDYFVSQIEKYDSDSLVIYSSDAYDLNRPEAVELFKNQPFPFTQEMYNYPYNAAKGKVFDQILDTNCTFEEFSNRHGNYKPGYHLMWMIDEFYFADCVNNKNHGIEVHKLKRGYISPWIADRRIDRGNFPVKLEWDGEIEFQKKYGFYDEKKLRDGYYIDVNCCRPYSKYKQAIDDLVDIVLGDKKIKEIDLDHRTDLCDIMDKYKSDKASKPDWVDYGGHNYTRFYSQIFDEFRNKDIDLFELGIGTNNPSIPCNMGESGIPGASLRGWKEYFQNANIHGADIDNNILFQEERIQTLFCDQTDPQEIKYMWDKFGKKMDIIIDDGYHNFNANLTFLNNSLSNLNLGGYYIVEDITEIDLYKWTREITGLEKKYPGYEFSLVKLKWTHADNNLLVIKNKMIKNNIQNNRMYDLGVKHQTDKISHHRYDRIYPLFLDRLQSAPIKLFEIGCGSDYASFNMWKEYFSNGMIFSMDINEEIKTDRGIVYKGDQTKKEDLNRMVETIGKCDIIIDDGSHVPQHQIETFNYLFENMLENGGIYIIEDIECNYWNPRNTIYNYQIGDYNIVDYFQSLPHKINSEFSNMKNHKLISSLTFFKNCIILTKMTSDEIEENKQEYRFKNML